MKYFIDKLISRLDERITSAERVVNRLESMHDGMCDPKRIVRWRAKIEAYEEVAEIVLQLYKQLYGKEKREPLNKELDIKFRKLRKATEALKRTGG